MSDETLFHEARHKQAADRATFLASACKGDRNLRERVEALLAAHDDPDSLLDKAAIELNATIEQSQAAMPLNEQPGALIGSYKLLEQIGEGGMGVVYMADQQTPVRRRVALKIIKAGMDTRQVIARFEAERQALALMDHPNIARVLDAGATGSGRPYFVMELVRAIPITRYCDQNDLPVRERLELFIQVCEAVQHAHQKGIIHRDIKPANVLVTLHDGRPVPKVIDFGIAKATNFQLTEKTLFTAFADMVGTPLYMSPEQAEMTGLDIDTRSDIYSLGVLLYELLTGTTPFDQKRFREAAYVEMVRIIREEEPPLPSTRLSTLGETRTATASHRHVDSRRLSRLVEGDLDWIVMKSLEKDRTRRYDTANNLAADVLRHLRDEPVEARPPTLVYRFRKFARRNHVALITSGLVVGALIAGTVASTWQAIRATSAEKLTQLHLAAEKDARADANGARERTVAQQAIAEQEAFTVRRNLYSAHITLIEQSLQRGKTGVAMAQLEAERPQSNSEDLRGFEWYYLWQRCNEGHRFTLRGHQGPIEKVAFSPDGTCLVSASGDGTVKLWDATTGNLEKTLRGHTDQVTSVEFSPDGKILASGSRDGTAKLWEVATGVVSATFTGHKAAVTAVAFSTNGETLATGSTDCTVKLWKVSTRKEVANLVATPFSDDDEVRSVVFSPDGETLVLGLINTIQLWGLADHTIRSTLPGDPLILRSIAISPDGTTLASAGAKGVTLRNLDKGQERASLTLASDEAKAVAYSPDGKTVCVGTTSGDVVCWNPDTGQRRVYAHIASIHTVAFSPDGKTLASAGKDRSIKLWDLTKELIPSSLNLSKGVLWCLAFSPDGKTIVFGGDRTLRLFDVATRQELGSFEDQPDALSVAYSPDGQTLASCGHEIILWDLTTRQKKCVLEKPTRDVYAIAFSPDGKTLAVGGQDTTVALWDLATRQRLTTLRGHTSWVWSVAFSPDGKTLASGCDDSTVKVWDAATGKELRTIRGFSSKVRSVAFSPDGETLFATDWIDLSAWNVATGQPVGLWWTRENRLPTNGLAVWPNGKSLATGNGGEIKIWDASIEDARATLAGHTQEICGVAISPDGRTVGTTSNDGTGKLWPSATEQDVLNESSIADFREELAIKTARRARTLALSGEQEEAAKLYTQAQTLYLQLQGDFSDQVEYWSEAGQVCFGLQQWAQAIENDSKAVALTPEDAATWNRRAVAESAQGQHAKALADLSKAITLQPNASLYWCNRACEYAKVAEPNKADGDYAKAVELSSNQIAAWHGQALACLTANDSVGYRHACGEILARFQSLEQPEFAEDAILVCTLAPNGIFDYAPILKLAENVMAQRPGKFVALSALGAAQYRAGNFDQAVQRLANAEAAYVLANEKRWPQAANWFFLAMAHKRLGHAADAKRWFDKAAEYEATQRSAPFTDDVRPATQSREVDLDSWGYSRFGKPEDTIGEPRCLTHRRTLAILRHEAESVMTSLDAK